MADGTAAEPRQVSFAESVGKTVKGVYVGADTLWVSWADGTYSTAEAVPDGCDEARLDDPGPTLRAEPFAAMKAGVITEADMRRIEAEHRAAQIEADRREYERLRARFEADPRGA